MHIFQCAELMIKLPHSWRSVTLSYASTMKIFKFLHASHSLITPARLQKKIRGGNIDNIRRLVVILHG